MLHNIRYALRSFARSPGFTATAVLTIALGIGANLAMFSVLNTAVLRPLPYANPDRVVLLWETKRLLKSDRITVAAPNYDDWRANQHVFSEMSLIKGATFRLVRSGETRNVQGLSVGAGYFPLLGVVPVLGRTFTPAGQNVLVLSHRLWQTAFAADPNIVGQHVTLDASAYTVVGVLPANFYFPEFGKTWDLVTPLSLSPAERTSRDAHVGGVVARLRDGVTLARAQQEMDAIASRLEHDFPATNTGSGIRLVPIEEQAAGAIRPTLTALLGAVGLVLLIACSNVANLLLVRSTARRHEMSIRIALGASRRHLLNQLLTESFVLAGPGGAAGVLLAWALLPILKRIPANIPRLDQLTIDTPVLLFAVAITLLCGVLFGFAPALRLPRAALRVMVVAEVSLAFVLLVGASLLLESLYRVVTTDPGFHAGRLTTARIALPPTGPRLEFQTHLLERVRQLPGVTAAALTSNLPIGGQSWSTFFSIEGSPLATGDALSSELRVVSPGYFETMEIPVLSGRTFQNADTADRPPAAIVNDVLARRYFPGRDPLGQRVKWGRLDDHAFPQWFIVVGVVGSVRHRSLESPTSPELYMCSQQSEAGHPLAPSDFALVVRSERGAPPLASVVSVPLTDVRTMEQVLSRSLVPREFNTVLFAAFAALALVLAWIGTYGVIACTTAMRTREIGIRIAIGAGRSHILRLVIAQGMRLAAIGIALGIVASWILARFVASLLYGTPPYSYALVAASIAIATAALPASYLPARRAAAIDPATALRSE